MQVQNETKGNTGTFYIEIGKERLALLDYTLSPGILIIEHTEVDESLKGQRIGNLLVDHAVAYARTNDLKVIAHCPFAKVIFKKDPDKYADILKN